MKCIFIYTKPSFNALNVHTVASNTEHISSVLSHTAVRFSTKCAKLKGSPEIKSLVARQHVPLDRHDVPELKRACCASFQTFMQFYLQTSIITLFY